MPQRTQIPSRTHLWFWSPDIAIPLMQNHGGSVGCPWVGAISTILENMFKVSIFLPPKLGLTRAFWMYSTKMPIEANGIYHHVLWSIISLKDKYFQFSPSYSYGFKENTYILWGQLWGWQKSMMIVLICFNVVSNANWYGQNVSGISPLGLDDYRFIFRVDFVDLFMLLLGLFCGHNHRSL